MEFIISGLLLLMYSFKTFIKNKLLYPSVVFGVMWGLAFMLCGLIQTDYLFPELKERYHFSYMNQYSLPFSIVSVIGFKLAHLCKTAYFYDSISIEGLKKLLDKYQWIMYVSFFMGILGIILFINHFGITSYSQYRIIFVTMEKPPFLSLVFRIGGYAVIFASIYVLFLGLYHGKTEVHRKELILNFLLFSTQLMSTGGRLFLFYFIIYYLSSFTVGRYSEVNKPFISKKELKIMVPFFAVLLCLVSVLSILRSSGDFSGKEKAGQKYLYITDGIRTTDFCMKKFEGHLTYEYGINTFGKNGGANMARFRKYMHGGPLGPTVFSILVPLYLDFGIFYSLFIWLIIAFFIEWLALLTMQKINVINFIIFLLLTKVMYESVVFNCFSQNYYFIELIILLYIFRRRLFPDFY